MTDRRTLIAGGLAALLPLRVSAQATAERFPLWPKAAPGGEGRAIADQWVKRSPTGGADDIAWPHVATPMLTVVRPTKPNGAAVLICPGGGYARVAVGRTGGGVSVPGQQSRVDLGEEIAEGRRSGPQVRRGQGRHRPGPGPRGCGRGHWPPFWT